MRLLALLLLWLSACKRAHRLAVILFLFSLSACQRAHAQTTLGIWFVGVNSSTPPILPSDISSILASNSLNYTSYAYSETDPYLSLQVCGLGTITLSLSQSTCVACAPGTYQSIPAQSSCSTCSTGYYATSNSSGAISSAICAICQQGTYSLAGDPSCTTCGVNTWSDVGYGACQSCPGNSSSQAGVYLLGCICAPGFHYNRLFFPFTCDQCQGGYWSPGDSEICSICQQGTYSLAGAPGCTTCGVNTWSDVGYRACQSCPGNSSSQAGSYLFGCICAPGFHYNRLGFPYTCDQCQGGYWSPGDSEICIACPAGSASPFLGAVSAGTCSTCGVGFYAESGASLCRPCAAGTTSLVIGASSCSPCQPGYWAGAGDTKCTACRNGTYSTAYGAGDISFCQACAGGTYATGAARTACYACGAGSYTPSGGSQCLVCGVGTFAEPQSTSCLGCPVNSLGSGGTDASGCVCSAGYYPYYRTRGVGGVESVVGATIKQHVFTSDGTLRLYLQTVVNIYCGDVLWGAYVWAKGNQAISVGGCGQITISYIISGAFYAGDSPTYFKCAGCSPGYISSAGDASCQACPAGTEQPASASSTCVACAPGYINAVPGTPSCAQCAGGTIQFLNSLACTTCPVGSYSAGGATVCLACPVNTYSQGGASQCTPCPYFSISLGGGGIGQCVCQAGYVGSYSPSFVCTACASGTYSLLNASSCSSCGPGSYSVSPAGQCVQCARGTYQPSSGLGACLPCQAGTLSDPGAPQCSPCPSPLYCTGGGLYSSCPLGTYSNLLGLISADQCPICPVNSFCQASGEIEACPAHTTSSAGSTSKLNCLCNPGYVCTYKKAVRVNVTLPLTQAQFALVRDQFLQSVANAAGVDVSQVSIIGLTLMDPHRRRLMQDTLVGGDAPMLIIHIHIEGAERLQKLGAHLRIATGIRRIRTRTRTAHRIIILRK